MSWGSGARRCERSSSSSAIVIWFFIDLFVVDFGVVWRGALGGEIIEALTLASAILAINGKKELVVLFGIQAMNVIS
jgi:hypothetical protein